MSDEGLKIVSLTAENVKRLKAITIHPDGDVVEIKGRNGQGKTSVLDSIWFALQGAAAGKVNPIPLRKGTEKGKIVIDIGMFQVTRTFTENGSALKVEAGDASFKSPQGLLDGLVGALSFDPLGWAEMEPKKQRSALLELVDLGFDIDAADALRKETFDKRTGVNREVKALEAQLADMPNPTDAPPEEVSVAAVSADYQKALEERRLNLEKRAKLDKLRMEAEDLDHSIKVVEASLLEKKESLKKMVAEGKALRAEVDKLVDPDVDALLEKINTVEINNKKVRDAKARAAKKADLDDAKKEADRLTASLEEIDQKKVAGLASAKFPVEGLGFDETGVTYNGTPFSQASTAEKLRVSLAVAMAANPKLRVIRITDGSLLDKDNMALIREMAADKGYQVWIERVADAADGVGVYIEDGEIVPPEKEG